MIAPVVIVALISIYYIAIGLTVFSLVMYWKAFYVKDFLKKEK